MGVHPLIGRSGLRDAFPEIPWEDNTSRGRAFGLLKRLNEPASASQVAGGGLSDGLRSRYTILCPPWERKTDGVARASAAPAGAAAF